MKAPLLSIAGFDPSAGAGVLADIKTMQAFGHYGMGVNTVQTFQNEEKVVDVHWLDSNDILRQLDVLCENHSFDFIKIGVVESIIVLDIIIEKIRNYFPKATIVWDPVLHASAGFSFMKPEAGKHMERVLENVDLITPNKKEIELISGAAGKEHWKKMPVDMVVTSYQVQGGNIHDLLLSGEEEFLISAPSVGTEKHGTGCVYSSALLCNLAEGKSLPESAAAAQRAVGKYRNSSKGLLGRHKLHKKVEQYE